MWIGRSWLVLYLLCVRERVPVGRGTGTGKHPPSNQGRRMGIAKDGNSIRVMVLVQTISDQCLNIITASDFYFLFPNADEEAMLF